MAGVNAWDDEKFPVPLFIQEPYDPRKIPMYCKDKVYCDGVEWSLEEIRARRYGYGKISSNNSNSSSILNGATSACKEVPLSEIDANAINPKPKEISGRNTPPVVKPQIKESSFKKEFLKTPGMTAASIDKENPGRAKNFLLLDLLPSAPISGSLGFSKETDKENLPQSAGIHCLEDDGLSAFDATSYTKAFNAPISSSTPFIGDRNALKNQHKESDISELVNEKTFVVPSSAPTKELSVIEESSKEMMVGSIGTTPASTAPPAQYERGVNPKPSKEKLPQSAGIHCLEDDGLSAFDATSYTKAFNAPTSSSTPFIGDRNALNNQHKESDISDVVNEKTFVVPSSAPTKELSVIEESSKEMMVGSIGTTPASTAPPAQYERGVNPKLSKENVRTSKELQCNQKSRELTEEEKLCHLMGEVILSDDPFDIEFNLKHLKSHSLLEKDRKGFFSMSCKTPICKLNSDISLRQDQENDHQLKSLKVIGQGAYAKVYKACSSKYRQTVAIKVQKPACEWEFYISRKIHERIQQYSLRSSFMEVKEAYMFLDGSLLIYDYVEYGNLLSVINLYKIRKIKLPEVLILYFTIDLLKILSCLHACHIIHGDIKPDNFLLRIIPSEKPNGITPSLQLIDLGRCIDMSLYPKGACFSTTLQKSYFQCVEMRTKRPWSYQLDLFGAASVVHCLLFGEFMEIHCKDNIWSINKKVPRNMNQQLWNNIFNTFLNISSCNKLPNINEMIKKMESYYMSKLAHEMGPARERLRKMLNEDCTKRK